MANRVLITDLPKYPICTISELLNGTTPTEFSTAHPDHLNRRIVKLENKREIMVVLHPLTNEVFAMDRFCYHHGYPLESGDIEDIVAVENMEKKNMSDDEQQQQQKRRGEGMVIPRQKGPLKFNKEEHLNASSKALQSNSELLTKKENEAAAASSSVSPTYTSAHYKLVKPGLLEVDYEDPTKFHDDDDYVFPIITCTLHNRIFDLRTGDMISRAVVRRPIKTPNGKNETDEEEKCLVSESIGCHQRIHPITIERKNKDDNDDGMIYLHDTFGFSVPMRRPGSVPVNMEDRSHLMFLAKKKVLSDKENKAAEPKV